MCLDKFRTMRYNKIRKEGSNLKEFFCDITTVTDDDLGQWYQQMQPERREKCKRLKKETAQKLCIATDHLARTGLAEFLGKDTNEIEILISPSGKPYLAGNPAYFSISHSGTMAVCAVSKHPIGIDIEEIRPVMTEARERICTPLEWTYLQEAPDDEARILRFFFLWTRKEAVFKVVGTLPRRDRETDVLNLPEGWSVTSRKIGNYCLSIVEKCKNVQ